MKIGVIARSEATKSHALRGIKIVRESEPQSFSRKIASLPLVARNDTNLDGNDFI